MFENASNDLFLACRLPASRGGGGGGDLFFAAQSTAGNRLSNIKMLTRANTVICSPRGFKARCFFSTVPDMFCTWYKVVQSYVQHHLV